MKTDLVRRAMAGDHDAFVRIVDEALPGLYASATSILRDRSLAEEHFAASNDCSGARIKLRAVVTIEMRP